MDPAAKPARGRKRQPKKGAKAQEEQAGGGEGSSQWEAAGAITPGQEEGEAAEPAAAPKPSLSQRLTQSIKQLSHFGAKPAKEVGLVGAVGVLMSVLMSASVCDGGDGGGRRLSRLPHIHALPSWTTARMGWS